MPKKRWTHPPSEMDAVIRWLVRHARAVRSKGAGALPTAKADRLAGIVRRFDPGHPALANCPWGWRVAPGVTHLYPPVADIPCRYSSEEEIPEDARTADRWIVTPKFDGASVVAYYKNGVLRRCITRGDGCSGWDVTNNVLERIPAVIYPHCRKRRRERFTGYIRCIATVNAKEFFRRHPKTPSLKDAILDLLTVETDAPSGAEYLNIVPVNIYNAPYKQYVRVGSPGWDVVTKDFANKLKFDVVTGGLAGCLSEEYASSLSRPCPNKGLVVRAYSGDKLLCVFVYEIKNESASAIMTVKSVAWKTLGSGKIYPTVICDGAELDGYSYRAVLSGGIGAGARISVSCGRNDHLRLEYATRLPEAGYTLDVKCSFGCDPEFLELGAVHAYCRNPRCPAAMLSMFKTVMDMFAPRHFSIVMRERVMRHFHNSVFEFWDYYKEADAVSPATVVIEGLTPDAKEKYCGMLRAMMRWELTLFQLVKLCGIERMGGNSAAFISGKASNSKELTAWAEETATLPVDWNIGRKASENWTRRHYLVKEVLKYFKITNKSSVL